MSLRTERVASLIKEEVGMIMTREYQDPSYGLITVTDVHMTPDLRIAKIYVSIMGTPEVKERTLAMLERQKPEIRSGLGRHLRMKFIPIVQFYVDETLDRVEKINRIIREIHKNDRQEGA